MSVAGIRSNQGDHYQILVAIDWALTVLSDPDYLWLEIDSVAHEVDDVVVGTCSDTLIACQCKKNQTDFKTWSIANLGDELNKAFRLLVKNPKAKVRFYSRNNFGDLAKLREHSLTQADAASYQASLCEANRATDAALALRLTASTTALSAYEFLCRTQFETTPDAQRMEMLLRERLRNLATRPDAAYDALWRHLEQLSARLGGDISTATRHRLDKDDLKRILSEAGAMLVPPMDIAQVRTSFAATSRIDRAWRTDIAGQRIPNPVLAQLIAAIEAKKRAILLSGLPGSGKTCVMLALQEALEQAAQTKADIVPLFIQSRAFADCASGQEREALGLATNWVEQAARLAENAQVVVILDSLDVLSIAREHSVLTYFLAQLDRLLLHPNISVVTACRDFDRRYDRRIAERKWDCELICQPLDWEADIAPLLQKLGMATEVIDPVTRALISNPRELALFVELAQREGSFNVVTAQALAQRYLDVIVRGNSALGDAALQAIEAIAAEMLTSRSLAVPYQRFKATDNILRTLCSLNVLQQTTDGKLTFGHQTLLDVLVISGALRSGIKLNEFIQNLSPVPFVRPSIRSFVAQLALGERREFRKQLRAVLTGNAAFHIRRLLAESFAAQKPQDEDWPFIRDLYDQHREVFQVIYSGAEAIEWHYFWLKYLVPHLMNARDAEGVKRHTYRIASWANEDTAGVLGFWMKVLELDWLHATEIAAQLSFSLREIKSGNIVLVAPLLERLLDLPRPKYSQLGKSIARCIAAGGADDAMLWRYIAGDVSDKDLLEFKFDNKLHCSPNEFGNREENFLCQRMVQSTTLLALALASIERWSNVRSARFGEPRIGYRYGFLRETSYEKVHTQVDIRPVDSVNILFDALEGAILHHAKTNSDWWQNNREPLCSSREGALIYFAILACSAAPEANLDLIGRMLCDQNLLESRLSYELGTLIQAAFIHLSAPTQDAVMASILCVRGQCFDEKYLHFWTLNAQAEFIITIPCYLRSPQAQAVVDEYEEMAGKLIRQPDIHMRGGMVTAPFSYEVFLNSSNEGVLCLLSHYVDHESRSDGFWVGGEREVGRQLQEAASRHPTRFLGLLPGYWGRISERFRDDILDGVANYLAYRYGNLRSDNKWEPIEEADASALATMILDELERHPQHWHWRRAAAKALEACSSVIYDAESTERLIFLAIDFEGLHEKDPISGDNVELIGLGINMAKGDVAEALMTLVANLLERGCEFPDLLLPALRRFAGDKHPAIRALILNRLPHLQNRAFDLGWELFHIAMQDADGLWEIAESCLYYAYRNHFEVVRSLLARLYSEGSGKDLATWGRISALAAMCKQIEFAELLQNLKALNNTAAWEGAAMVWTNFENIQHHQEQCFAGLEAGLKAGAPHAETLAAEMASLFRDISLLVAVPLALIQACFEIFKHDKREESERPHLFGIDEWLNATAQHDPLHALAATEIYLAYVRHCKRPFYDYDGSNLTQLMTRLFADAEEREEADNGAMLKRVVEVQDTLLSLGVNGVNDWLKAAERP